MLTNFIKKHLEQFGRLLAGPHHKIQEIKICQNAIPFWDVSAERVSATLFAADHGIRFHHLRRDVFESHTGLVNSHIIKFAELVEHGRCGKCLDDSTSFPPDFQQIKSQQRIYAQLINKFSVLIADATTICIPVRNEQHVCIVFNGGFQSNVNVWADGFGSLHFRKRWIACVVDLNDLRLATFQQSGEPACAVSPHSIHQYSKTCIFDLLQIYQFLEIDDVGFGGIEHNDL